jgi:hypothetical protein
MPSGQLLSNKMLFPTIGLAIHKTDRLTIQITRDRHFDNCLNRIFDFGCTIDDGLTNAIGEAIDQNTNHITQQFIEETAMKGYIQDQSIVLTEDLPTNLNNGDEVEVVITIVNKSRTISASLDLPTTYFDRARQWDNIPDNLASQLKAEFADEDQAFAEATLTNYLSMTQETTA